jgi:hypothetical protein
MRWKVSVTSWLKRGTVSAIRGRRRRLPSSVRKDPRRHLIVFGIRQKIGFGIKASVSKKQFDDLFPKKLERCPGFGDLVIDPG